MIIPALNEADNLTRILPVVYAAPQVEVILVDGGSVDGTIEVAKSFHTKIIHACPGRASQMNQGAAMATGNILLFLHADTRLPQQWDQQLILTLARPKAIAGAFALKIDGKSFGLRLVEWGVQLRSRYCQMPYGDQALFMPAKVFHELGGFPELPIMEDFELVRQLRRRGRIAIAPATVLTSSRRWQSLGVVSTTLVNQLVIAGYFLGVSPQTLVRWYRYWGKRR